MAATAKEISKDAKAALRRHFHMERRTEGFRQWKTVFHITPDRLWQNPLNHQRARCHGATTVIGPSEGDRRLAEPP